MPPISTYCDPSTGVDNTQNKDPSYYDEEAADRQPQLENKSLSNPPIPDLGDDSNDQRSILQRPQIENPTPAPSNDSPKDVPVPTEASFSN